MALVKCRECKKQYSNTLEACPHCGYKPPKKFYCATCKEVFFGYEEKLSKRICSYCGFPVLEDHSEIKITPEELIEQNAIVEKEKAEVERIIRGWQGQIEQYRDKMIQTWRSEVGERISTLESEIREKNEEIENLGFFSFGKKNELKKAIVQLQEHLQMEKEKIDSIEKAEQRMTKIIEKEVSNNGGYTFRGQLNAYLEGFVRRVQRNNSDYTAIRELTKDRLFQVLADNGRPMAKFDIISTLRKSYPEYEDIANGPFFGYLRELEKEGLISEKMGLAMRRGRTGRLEEEREMFYFCNRDSFSIPTGPKPEALFLTDTEKLLVVKQVQQRMGGQYSSYMEALAEKFGYGPIRKYAIQAMNSAIQKEVISSMAAITNAGAAVVNSKKASPALVGGAVNALTGPIAGTAAAYTTAMQNREKDIRRKHAEFLRDIYLAQNAQDLSKARLYVSDVEQLDYKLLQMEYASVGSSK